VNAIHALSQLSYGPFQKSETGNQKPEASKAGGWVAAMISEIDLGCEVRRFKENAPARAVAGASGFWFLAFGF
jgi:hypothetical protein